jgi:hypothetical protein
MTLKEITKIIEDFREGKITKEQLRELIPNPLPEKVILPDDIKEVLKEETKEEKK